MIWRSLIIAGYAGLAIAVGVTSGRGGLIVIAFMSVWAVVWLVFSLLWGWMDRARRRLLERPPSPS